MKFTKSFHRARHSLYHGRTDDLGCLRYCVNNHKQLTPWRHWTYLEGPRISMCTVPYKNRFTFTFQKTFQDSSLLSHYIKKGVGRIILQVLGRTNRLLSLIRHGPHWKRRVQQFFYCCLCIRYRDNVSTEPLRNNDGAIFTLPLPSNDRGDTQTHRQQRYPISLLLFFSK
jgi:hypothetical protein